MIYIWSVGLKTQLSRKSDILSHLKHPISKNKREPFCMIVMKKNVLCSIKQN